MGLFDKLKNIISKKEKIVNDDVVEKEKLQNQNEEKEVKIEKEKKEETEEIEKIKEETKIEDEQNSKQTIETYDKGLEKTRKEFVSKLSLLGHKYTRVNEEYFEELEDLLIMADIGVKTVMDFIEKLKDRVKKENITDTEYLQEVIVDELFIIYVDGESLSDKINMQQSGPTVILMVGVNGVGKTTTIAKLAYKYKNMGKKVAMIAADTFRAGAVKQLEEWANRTGSIFYGKEDTDPAGVIYDGLDKAVKQSADIVLIDTAGRLQNKVNLMNELEKINRVIGKFIPNAPHETLLVIDATTGQNGILQAKAFKEITNITGIVLTKLDGTAKGGIVLAIKEDVGLPVKFIGLGEKMEDLQTFDIENYIYGLFKDMIK
ncbi:MAG: signal recognition particle-docking protein FtsY [Firmicutes bacterium]|nr:signal recognition particle-docking protein FtsY [Bacillota bacterium]